MKMMLLAIIAKQDDEIVKFRLYDADSGQVGEYPYQNIYGVLARGYSIEGLKISRKHIAANKNFNLNNYTWIDIATGQLVKNKNNLLVLRRHDDNTYTLVDINGNKARLTEPVIRQNVLTKGINFQNAVISGQINQIDINPLDEKFILEDPDEAVKYNAAAVNRQLNRKNKDRAASRATQKPAPVQPVKPVIDPNKLQEFSEKFYVRKNDYGDYTLEGVKPYTNIDSDLIIPEGIAVIGYGAFKNQQTLKNVYCPSTLRMILSSAFFEQSIEQIHLQEGIIQIGTQAFFRTYNLKEFIGPDSLEKIESNGFCESGIKYLKLKGRLEKIQDQAFNATKKLEKVEIDCPKLEIGSYVFQDSGLSEIKLDSIVNIGYHMFRGCENLEEIRLPQKVKRIEEQAFQWAYGLKRIYVNDVTGYMSQSFGVQYDFNADVSERHIYLNGNIAKFKKKTAAKGSKRYSNDTTQFIYYTIHVKVPSKEYQMLLELQESWYSRFEIVREYDKNSKECKDIERIKKLQSLQGGQIVDIWFKDYVDSNEGLNDNNPISDKFDEYYPVELNVDGLRARDVQAGSLKYELAYPSCYNIQGESGDPASHTMIYQAWLTKKLINFVVSSMPDDSWILDIPERYFENIVIHAKVLGIQLINGLRLNQVTFSQRLFKNDNKNITVLMLTRTTKKDKDNKDSNRIRLVDDETKVLWTQILGETMIYLPDQKYQIPDITLESNLKAGDTLGRRGYSQSDNTILCGQQAYGDKLNDLVKIIRDDMFNYCIRFKMQNKDGYFWQPAQDKVLKLGRPVDKNANIELDAEYKQDYATLMIESCEYFDNSDLSSPEFWKSQFNGRAKDKSIDILKALKYGKYYQDLSDYVDEAEPATIADIANNYHNRILKLDLTDLDKYDMIRLLEDSELFEKMTEDEANLFKSTACIKPLKEMDMGIGGSYLKVYVQSKRAKLTKLQATIKGTCEDPDMLAKGYHQEINANLLYEYFDGEERHYGHTNYKPHQIEDMLNTLNNWNTLQTKIKTVNLFALAKNGCVFSSNGFRYTNQVSQPLFFGACTIKTKKRRKVRSNANNASMAFRVGINPVNGCQYLWIQLDEGALWALAPLKNIETGFKFIQALADGTEPEIVQRIRQMKFGDQNLGSIADAGDFIQCVLRKEQQRYEYRLALGIQTSLQNYIATNNSRTYEQIRDYN